MAKRRETPTTRLRKATKTRPSSEFPWLRKYFVTGLAGKLPDPNKPEVWVGLAQLAFTLRPEDRALKQAFVTFKLDPCDPRDWRELLDIFVEVLGPTLSTERKPAGRKTKWTLERREELVEAVDRIQRASPKKLTDRQACKRLTDAKDSPLYFRKTTPDALVRQVVKGRAQLFRRAIRRGENLPSYLSGRKNRAI